MALFRMHYQQKRENFITTELNGAFSGLRHFLATKNTLKMMKNAFYFTLKAFSFSRYLNFYLEFLVM